ncbi:MAG: hypothetical protein ACSLE0_08345 [Chitinophagaceae bacterium]
MPADNIKNIPSQNDLSPSEIYDLYAPAVYGRILKIVHKGPIAGKILEKVFIKAFKEKNLSGNNLNNPLISLLNHSREKSYQTLKALNIINECCAGATKSLADKK